MRREPEDTDAAAMMLSTDAVLSFLLRRELTRDRGARVALQGHVEGEFALVVGADDGLRAAACDARRTVARLAGDVARLQAV